MAAQCSKVYHMGMDRWIEFNNNPAGRRVGDCAVRAISVALDVDWETAFCMLAVNAFMMGDLPNADSVWGSILRQHGFYREAIPDTCPECYSAADFAADNPDGIFVLGFGGHVATIKDGRIYDAWDSSNEIPQFVWRRKDEE